MGNHENKQVVIYGHDDDGRHVKNWLDESDLRRLNVSVAINCRWQMGVKTSRVERLTIKSQEVGKKKIPYR